MKTDILIAGSGCAGLYCALHLPKDKEILIITKDIIEHSDSFLAQGGMCMLKDESDYESYYEDTMHAGHYENNPESVEIMIHSSPDTVKDLLGYGVDFHREEDGSLSFTREGGHSAKRILFHEDITGKEITSKLLEEARKRPNIKIIEHTTLLDILCKENVCYGAVIRTAEGEITTVTASYTVLACGGIGGLYRHSTNYRQLTGDGVAVAIEHGIELEHVNYVQIHPTTLYSEKKEERSFLISESVRGEGAVLYNAKKERFVNELLPRDVLTEKIHEQMEKDHMPYVWLSMEHIPREEIEQHFPNIVEHCREKGYDVFTECIPVVPAQHYFMGGIKVNMQSKTSMDQLYAIGETACNGVHGRNRLASNSLLESLVFAKRAALDMAEHFPEVKEMDEPAEQADLSRYQNAEALAETYKNDVLNEIERLNKLCTIQ
ncbi:L-aspartate oxidase [Roseburia sp. BX1005]|uniref:L-aspartate oxidase n=1 Tax=Roseburia zhanii TaxID=2763064 RepID=A0A923LQ25_9FIRM|nr:L-aspartate oxidase [Roseburia zhanii]MBC5713863.1 L-aspartate oxidase [Roseburia zhanii]